ncbi:MAG: hypothetical protein GAK35_02893 [Herbaspirillum frisingense]|uniref:Uncharacterized protein n=1 Tax=Herbaspirillum frisingense TaxID=92645 RepID=A0A7V8FVB0_9BURK|nr:MAG: hypothetical protein GAK35_02893 [Herbaspirillum frisingense]
MRAVDEFDDAKTVVDRFEEGLAMNPALRHFFLKPGPTQRCQFIIQSKAFRRQKYLDGSAHEEIEALPGSNLPAS